MDVEGGREGDSTALSTLPSFIGETIFPQEETQAGTEVVGVVDNEGEETRLEGNHELG